MSDGSSVDGLFLLASSKWHLTRRVLLHRNLDLSMLVQFNSNERTAEAFADVLWQADLRFHIIDIEKSGGSLLAIFEVGWRSGG